MKMKLLSAILAAFALALTGCMTPGQNAVAISIGAGEGVGTNLLKSHSTGGIVDPVYLAGYESEIPNVAGLMQGKITPADLGKILNAQGATSGLSASKLSVVGVLNGASSEWIKVNQGTPEGAIVDSDAKNFAIGLGNAVGLVTGTNYAPPTSMVPSTWLPRVALAGENSALPYQELPFRFDR